MNILDNSVNSFTPTLVYLLDQIEYKFQKEVTRKLINTLVLTCESWFEDMVDVNTQIKNK